jgi:hypothetical protein
MWLQDKRKEQARLKFHPTSPSVRLVRRPQPNGFGQRWPRSPRRPRFKPAFADSVRQSSKHPPHPPITRTAHSGIPPLRARILTPTNIPFPTSKFHSTPLTPYHQSHPSRSPGSQSRTRVNPTTHKPPLSLCKPHPPLPLYPTPLTRVLRSPLHFITRIQPPPHSLHPFRSFRSPTIPPC